MSRAALLLALATLVGGCYSVYAIRPEQAPRVNGSYVDTVSFPVVGIDGSLTTMSAIRSQSKITFDRPEGGTVTVKGQLGLDITTAAGRRYRFDHPVTARLEENVLHIRARSRSGRVRLDDVRSAEVRNLDYRKTILAGAGLAGAAGLPVTLLLLSI